MDSDPLSEKYFLNFCRFQFYFIKKLLTSYSVYEYETYRL